MSPAERPRQESNLCTRFRKPLLGRGLVRARGQAIVAYIKEVVRRCVAPEGARLNDPPSEMQDGALSRLPPSAGLTLYARRRSNMRNRFEIGGLVAAAVRIA